jgi:hypothetical protein
MDILQKKQTDEEELQENKEAGCGHGPVNMEAHYKVENRD